jgi:hypothetical protein
MFTQQNVLLCRAGSARVCRVFPQEWNCVKYDQFISHLFPSVIMVQHNCVVKFYTIYHIPFTIYHLPFTINLGAAYPFQNTHLKLVYIEHRA